MALLITKQNRPIFLSAEKARLLWLVKTGERKGSAKTQALIKQIAKWYLNRETAPKSYIESHPRVDDRPRPQLVAKARLPYID